MDSFEAIIKISEKIKRKENLRENIAHYLEMKDDYDNETFEDDIKISIDVPKIKEVRR